MNDNSKFVTTREYYLKYLSDIEELEKLILRASRIEAKIKKSKKTKAISSKNQNSRKKKTILS